MRLFLALALILAAATAGRTAPADGPVAVWTFNEPLRGLARDVSGGGHTAVTSTPPQYAPAPGGQALLFDGQSGLTVKNAPDISVTNALTLDLWLWVDDPDAPGTQYVVDKSGERYHLWIGQGGVPGFGLKCEGSRGDIGGGMDADDVIGSAGQFDLEIGSRLTPHLSLAFYSNIQPFARVNTDARTLYTGSAGAVAALHLRPSSAVDPWISLGSGVRGLLIENDDGTSITVGAELARVQLGTDFRLNEDVAIGPVIGASASLYGAAKPPMQEFAELSDKGINWTFTAGVAGRFNAFGTRR